MTAQISENLHDGEHQHALQSLPLSACPYLDWPPLDDSCTALWRGYVGRWEILDGRLYLVGLSARDKTGAAIALADLFPNYPDRVFAHWYSGTLCCPRGRLLKYRHMGWSCRYEAERLIEVKRGVVTGETLRRFADTDDASASPAQSAAGGTTQFARPRRPEGQA